jgi:2-keto-4-pentenoate hydratase/2-oxohepta-3-ene-1,7-dioic acid hydratase in catechol pathway
MKLVRFDAGAGPRHGLIREDAVIDVCRAGATWGSPLDAIRAGDHALDDLKRLVDAASADHALADVRLLAPIPRPGKYLAIGMNYRKHIEESARLGVEEPTRQFWFNKQTTCIVGPADEIVKPEVSDQVDYEVELGVVIGKPARHVSAADARDHIFGYMVVNDVSTRDWQYHSPTFTMGKSFDTHGPTGPWIVTADEIEDCHRLRLTCHVNGELRQSSDTSQMVHDVYRQIEYLTTAFTLEPGDILATGTPEGVGIAMSPPRFLKAGDVLRSEVEGVGVIENRVIAER